MIARYLKKTIMISQVSKKHFKWILKYLASVFVIFALYMELSRHWVPIGGTNSHLFDFEIPFLIILSMAFYFPAINKGVVKHILPTVPILILYIYFDIFYHFLSRAPRVSDIQNLDTISDFSVALSSGLILLFLIALLSIIVLLQQAFVNYSRKNFGISIFLKLLFLCALATIMSSSSFVNYAIAGYEYVDWSQRKSIKKNGRFRSFIYYGAQEKRNRAKLQSYISSKNIDIQETLYPGSVKRLSNVHLIVLESFIDPRLFKDVEFSKSPLAVELKKYLYKQSHFSHVISPVYGGGTAQAEFELLTGVRALAKVSSIEFNVMKGKKASSLVNHLKQHGYKSIATIATDKGYYNSPQAYKSLGFDNIYFLEGSEDFKKPADDDRIFDGTLLEYNIGTVKNFLNDGSAPIFNYVLGMYGHFPYRRNLRQRPDVVKVNHEDTRVHNIANQFYYRTRAVAIYIDELLSIDPTAIIYVTSDHLPPLIDTDIQYQFNKHLNISVLIDAGLPIHINNKKYFEIPWLIWDLLSEEKHERNFQSISMEDLYYKLLSESVY